MTLTLLIPGFVSAGISAGGAGANSAGAGIKPGEFIGRTVLGGTISKITGGKFANGAASAAFSAAISWAGANGSKAGGSEHGGASADVAQKGAEHHSRNSENDTHFEKLVSKGVFTIDEVEDYGEHGMKLATKLETKYHRQDVGNENNLKYTSKIADNESWWQRNISNRYGRYELIIKPVGDGYYVPVTDPTNMGTLNRGNDFISHYFRDIRPYKTFGNVRNQEGFQGY